MSHAEQADTLPAQPGSFLTETEAPTGIVDIALTLTKKRYI